MIHTFPAASGTRRVAYCDWRGCDRQSRSIRLGSGEVLATILRQTGWDLTNAGGRYRQYCPSHARPTKTPSPSAHRDDIAPGAAQHHPAAGEGTTEGGAS